MGQATGLRRVAKWVLIAIGVGVTGFAVVLGLSTWNVGAAKLTGRFVVTTQPGAIYFTTEQERGRFELTHGAADDTSIGHHFVDSLHVVDGMTGEALVPAVRFANERRGSTEPVIVGVTGGAAGGVVWVWNRGLEGYAAGTLTRVWENETLREVNGGAAMATDPEAYRVVQGLDAVVMRGEGGKYFRVDRASGRVLAVAEEALMRATGRASAAEAFEEGRGRGVSEGMVYGFSYLVRSFVLGEQWYGLFSPEEREGLTEYSARQEEMAGGEGARGLHRFSYIRDQFGQQVLDLKGGAAVGNGVYFGGAFLRRGSGFPAAVIREGEEVMVLHWEGREEGARPVVSRVNVREGREIWRTALPLAELKAYAEGEGTVVISGKGMQQTKGKERDAMIIVQLKDGGMRVVDLSK